MTNFWLHIPKSFMALAPMEDVTDTVFREVIESVSNPEILKVVFTEFTSTDGLCHDFGRNKVIDRLNVSITERKILQQSGTKLVAQIWGSEPENFFKSAQMLSESGQFDGIDINMGCPVKKVVKKKSCSALINFPDLAREIIQATKQGTHLPVSVKTRIGFNKIITEEWMSELLAENPAAITVHGRTQKMLSTGEAMWNEIGKVVQLRNQVKSDTIILGNGDITSYEMAMSKVKEFGVDGVMVGTGIFKNPWLFNENQSFTDIKIRLTLLKKHILLFNKTWDCSHFNVMKRFFKIYINGFEGAAEWRDKLMHTANCTEALQLVEFFETNKILSI